jgi:hypothetical protein
LYKKGDCPGKHGTNGNPKLIGISGRRKRGYLKDRIIELAMNSKNKNIRDLYRGKNSLRRVYQPSSNLVMNENSDLLEDSHNILNRGKNYFS